MQRFETVRADYQSAFRAGVVFVANVNRFFTAGAFYEVIPGDDPAFGVVVIPFLSHRSFLLDRRSLFGDLFEETASWPFQPPVGLFSACDPEFRTLVKRFSVVVLTLQVSTRPAVLSWSAPVLSEHRPHPLWEGVLMVSFEPVLDLFR